ncbi:hypothetical protein PR202_gb24212 [Eleusine coracana subsp. coracana]|uniref:KIB1-4 beta-propeller domain-containing protein n=1 Tax=Eleusine coracana subsp. coracana TaxID=191504 RepID=A0AAV5FKV7_ELECO|nr:hypothetical protein PR202_gb24212 [Eleusine coracana subsp. coracana]
MGHASSAISFDAHKAYDVSFPQGLCFVACCGSSHGWLFLVNELANLVLYNPFTSRMIPLPPITDFTCIEAVDGGKAYHFEKFRVFDAKELATWFYQKAVVWQSIQRAGENKWQVASTLAVNEHDRYADCVYHNGRFYTVTFEGIVEKWDLDGSDGPAKEVVAK